MLYDDFHVYLVKVPPPPPPAAAATDIWPHLAPRPTVGRPSGPRMVVPSLHGAGGVVDLLSESTYIDTIRWKMFSETGPSFRDSPCTSLC